MFQFKIHSSLCHQSSMINKSNIIRFVSYFTNSFTINPFNEYTLIIPSDPPYIIAFPSLFNINENFQKYLLSRELIGIFWIMLSF